MDFLLHLDIVETLKAAGYLGLAGIIFAECGILLGILFPGDSLLFTAGLLASQGYFDIRIIIVLTFSMAVLGNLTGYAIGKRFGPSIFRNTNSRFFKKEYLERTQTFFEHHGTQSIILARFIPIVRTITPLFAGVGSMPFGPFFLHTVIGAFLWAVCLPLLGFILGRSIPDIDHYLLPIILLIVLASFAPALFHTIKKR